MKSYLFIQHLMSLIFFAIFIMFSVTSAFSLNFNALKFQVNKLSLNLLKLEVFCILRISRTF
jgi:hypothetical protein